jgi:hypothetical protein
MTTETPTAADIDELYQPTKTRATICLDSDLVLAIERLEAQLAVESRIDETQNRTPQAPQIAEQIVELREQAKSAEVEFVFRSIGRKAYTDLIRAHPPTEAQKTEAGANLAWNVDTFPPALLALACEAPLGTDEAWWRRKYDSWGTGQIARLWQTCLAAQGGVVEVPKAEAAYAMTRGYEPS